MSAELLSADKLISRALISLLRPSRAKAEPFSDEMLPEFLTVRVSLKIGLSASKRAALAVWNSAEFVLPDTELKA